MDLAWVIFDDFNNILFPSEKKGRRGFDFSAAGDLCRWLTVGGFEI